MVLMICAREALIDMMPSAGQNMSPSNGTDNIWPVTSITSVIAYAIVFNARPPDWHHRQCPVRIAGTVLSNVGPSLHFSRERLKSEDMRPASFRPFELYCPHVTHHGYRLVCYRVFAHKCASRHEQHVDCFNTLIT